MKADPYVVVHRLHSVPKVLRDPSDAPKRPAVVVPARILAKTLRDQWIDVDRPTPHHLDVHVVREICVKADGHHTTLSIAMELRTASA